MKLFAVAGGSVGRASSGAGAASRVARPAAKARREIGEFIEIVPYTSVQTMGRRQKAPGSYGPCEKKLQPGRPMEPDQADLSPRGRGNKMANRARQPAQPTWVGSVAPKTRELPRVRLDKRRYRRGDHGP